MVRQRAEPLGENIRVCQTVKFIRMTMYPRGARPNRWQSLHMVCKYLAPLHFARSVTTIKPVYSLQRHHDVWHVGASAKMRFTERL